MDKKNKTVNYKIAYRKWLLSSRREIPAIM